MRLALILPLVAVVLTTGSCVKLGPLDGYSDDPVAVWKSDSSGNSVKSEARTVPVNSETNSKALLREVNLKVDLVPRGTHGRKVVRPMTPRYITIHSTQNYSADAERHSLALKRGALRARKRRGGNRIGYLIWHFTVDDKRAIQHMPTNEQGEHADFDGPGNNYSIGIEMCEERGSNVKTTIDRTAKLTAYLMHTKGIPLSRVVPHYHWPRRGTSKPHKNCPHFLLDNGRPGPKWRAFQGRVNAYYKRISSQAVASR
jgi:N-acetylmuramoyl-L-alanine amidase